jgi:glucan phosphoethanolaminetransferase (alkaline phosphatase superfamily)
MTNETINTNSQNAARLIKVLGWLVLFIIGTMAGSVLVVKFMAEEFERANPTFWPVVIACLILGFILLFVAKALAQHKQWARYAGMFFAAWALILFPVGTVLGLFILSYIYKGWDEK